MFRMLKVKHFTETSGRISLLPKVSSTRVTGTGQSPDDSSKDTALLVFIDNKYKTVDSSDGRVLGGRSIVERLSAATFCLAVPGRSALKIHKHVFHNPARQMMKSNANEQSLLHQLGWVQENATASRAWQA
ncbi:hypothetical protein T05_14007 [Trichinella murrelli]|uniref:Uncharacterized protein n=1 Tax=Trichinella murrelli TaxID=144512 RepID=A0A0V0UF36_9BILA|nr:hypothetical protein T05_14007 [Trichinella murrelli]